MIPVYPRLNVMFFKFLFIYKAFFARVCFSMIYLPYLAKLRQRKVTTRSDDNFMPFCFVLFWNLVFMCKGSQPRIYADLLRVNSRVKDTHQRNSSAYKSTNMGIWVVGTLNQLFIRSS